MDRLRIIYVSFSLIIFTQTTFGADRPVAVGGVLDLSEYSFLDNGPVNLSGEWQLYWNKFINQASESDDEEAFLVEVPASWNQYIRQGYPFYRTGFATYRLKVFLPQGSRRIGIKIHDVYSSSSYYINGRKIGNVGFPAANRYQTVIKVREPFMEVVGDAQTIDLLVHVSNYEHRAGGIRGNITIGLPDQIKELQRKSSNLNFLLMGAFLIIGIYFMSLYLIRYEKYRLFFSMICILMVFRIIIIGEVEFYNNLNISSIARFRLEYLSFYLIIPFFILMIQSLFPFEFNKIAFRSLLWFSLAFILIVLFTPLMVFSYTLNIYQVYFIIVAIIILYVLIQAWIRGRTYAPAFTIGMTLLLIGVINDLLYITDNIETGNISQYAMFIYLIIYANIFAAKTLRLVNRTESLTLEVQEINANLETLVEERTTELKESTRRIDEQRIELEKTNKNLSKAIASRNRMFSIIGHDVRGPIGYIRQGLDLMAENNQSLDKDDKELIALMATSAQKTFDLLENLLLWGRTQVGSLDPNPAKIVLRTVIDESLEIMDLGIRDKSLKLKVYVDKTLKVWFDRDHLQLVIRNLLSNAIKFTPNGGQITVSVMKKFTDKMLLLEVSDTGIGIPEEMQECVFNPDEIYTVNGTNQEKGSGLGLKLCKEIMEANGGTISFTSKSGKGSAFTISLLTDPPK